MKICRKNLASILLFVMIVCFALSAVFAFSVKNQEVLADNITTYDFEQSTDGDMFLAAPNSGGNWAISDGVLKPLGGWYVTYLKTPIDLTKDVTISLDFCLPTDYQQFNVAIAQSATDMKNDAMGLSFRNSTVWLSNELGAGWQGENTSNGYADGQEHNLTLSVSNKVLSFEIGGQAYSSLNGAPSTLSLTADTGYLVIQATETASYIDNVTVTEATAPSNSIASADFEQASDASKFATNGTGWVINEGKFYSNAAWGMTYYATALDLTKEQTLTLDLYIDNDEADTVKAFYIGFAGEIGATVSNFKGLVVNTGTVWFTSSFGTQASGWIGENNTLSLYGVEHKITVNIKDGKMSFEIDGVPLVCNSGISTMDVPANSGYFVMQATNGGCYIDNFLVEEPKLDDGVIDFEVATDAELFSKLGMVEWQIADGKFYPAEASDLYSGNAIKLNQAIDLTTDKVISFDFAIDSYNFDVALLDVNASNIWGTALGLHFTDYENIGKITLNNNIDNANWLGDYVLESTFADSTQRNLKIKVASGVITYYIDGVQIVCSNDVKSAVKPADSAYLVLRACGTGTYIDNLKITEAKSISVKNIAGEEIDTISALDSVKLPARSEAGFIGYDVNGELYPAGYEIDVTDITEVVAVIVNLSTVDGAQIRTDTPTGLRFISSIDTASKTYLETIGVNFDLTTIIVKAEDVNFDVSAITLDGEYTKLTIKSTVGKINGDSYNFYGTLVEIKESHYAWKFAARASITITYADGTSATVYGTGGTARSVSEVAEALIAQEESNPSGDFNETELNIIRGFIVQTNTVFLSVDGDDNNDGKSFGSAVVSLSRAMELVGDERNIISVADGEYFIDQTVTVDKNVTLQSVNKGGAVFSGAKIIDNSLVKEVIDPVLGRVWEIPYAEKANQLYIDGSHATRARYPDAGQELRLLFADLTLRTLTIDKVDLGSFSSSDILNTIMVPSIAWAEAFLTVKAVSDTTTSGVATYQLSFAPSDSAFFERSIVIHPRASYHFENSKAFLSVAGEWFCDEVADKIYYIPHDGESLNSVVIRIPTTETLVKVSGSEQSKLNAVCFDGITFAYTAKNVDGKIGGQANLNNAYSSDFAGINANRPTSSVVVEFVDNFLFQNNVIKCTANGGLDLVQGVSNSKVSGNLFTAIGGNGVFAGASNTDAAVVEATLNNEAYQIKAVTVENNYLTDIGWQEYSGVGIIFSYSVDCKITHNDIRGSAYSGISVGWGWQTLQASKSFVGNNEISYNRITNICNILNDGGAIYLAGCQTGTKIINNYIADIYNYVYHYPLDRKTDYKTTGGVYSYSQIWWANAGVYLDTAAASADSNNPLIVSGNYIASDIENQKYEFNNVNSKMPTGQELYFTIDGKTMSQLKAMVNPINMENGVSASIYNETGVTDSSLIPTQPILFGSHTVSSSTVTVYGQNLDAQDIYLDGEKITTITAQTDSYITFTTSSYSAGGHLVSVGNSKIAVTTGIDFNYDSVTRFEEKFGSDFYNTLRYGSLAEKQEISTNASDFTSSEYPTGYSPELICDGEVATGWSMTMDDAPGYVSFKLKTASTVDKFILYGRIGAGDDLVSRSNFTITGITSSGERVVIYTTTGEAYSHYGMLIVEVGQSEHKDKVFSGFELKKNDNNYFFVAEVAVI